MLLGVVTVTSTVFSRPAGAVAIIQVAAGVKWAALLPPNLTGANLALLKSVPVKETMVPPQ